MPAPRFAGVIFDMDGVLCDSERYICEAACQMFAESHNTRVKPADFVPFVGAGEDRYLGGVAEQYHVKLNLAIDKPRTYEIYLQMIKGRLTPLPGAVAFIAACKQRGLKLAVATSADRIKLEGNLRQIGLPAAQFDAIITGSEVRKKKPDPEAFAKAAQLLGLPGPRCLVVEDAPNGIRAGKAMGARCLGLTTSFSDQELLLAGANWTAPDLAHVPPAVLG